MKKSLKGRGSDPTPLTIHMLCAHSAGRCQFEGCNKVLFTDSITFEQFNNTNVAHIVASSPSGPRGDALRSHQLSQSLDNLMLMCMDHHKLIDARPEEYTETVLLAMKKAQEKRVLELCDAMNMEASEILMVSSPIKGKTEVSINFNQAVEAIRPHKRPASIHGITIRVSSAAEYNTAAYWFETERQLVTSFDYLVRGALASIPNLHFSIFPMAPIPLIAKLGYLVGDKIRSDIYQKTRVPDTWSWQSKFQTNSFELSTHTSRPGNRIALVLSLTADISLERVLEVYDADSACIIRAKRLGVDCISSEKDLSEFWHLYQKVCDTVRNGSPQVRELSVFPAIPVACAFEIGRRYMPGVYPELTIYEDNSGFFKALTIGG